MTEKTSNFTVVIPSLNPDEKLSGVVSDVIGAGFDDIIIVNDGSSEANLHYFEELKTIPYCTVLTHPTNYGKGAALKTAFSYIKDNRPPDTVIVTADGDGQHRASDMLACAQAASDSPRSLVLGVRDFSGSNVPRRSRMGNRITSFVFRLGCGMKISDTQTGLRAFSSRLINDMLEIPGDRFEYETNMLLELKKRRIELKEVKIETVYLDENKSSHFRVFRDSFRIYRRIIGYMLSSGASAIIDIGLFYLLTLFLSRTLGSHSIIICTVAARVVSSIFNFSVNRQVVFGGKSDIKKALPKYYSLAAVQMLCSALLVKGASLLFSANSSWVVTLIKIAVDTVLFFVSYYIQREWVFKAQPRKEKNNK